jgi:hypothetical protein
MFAKYIREPNRQDKAQKEVWTYQTSILMETNKLLIRLLDNAQILLKCFTNPVL